jgi:Fe-S-cluster containining protein
LVVEVLPEDAEREPLIREKGSPIYTDARLTKSGKPELEGYLLSTGKGCVFLHAETQLCMIYRTRPFVCRLFDCDGEDKQELVQLGIQTDRSQELKAEPDSADAQMMVHVVEVNRPVRGGHVRGIHGRTEDVRGGTDIQVAVLGE